MNWTSLGIFASLTILCSTPMEARYRANDGTGIEIAQVSATAAATHRRVEQRIVLAQGEVRVPSDAQLERMEERAITRVPLDVTGAPPRPRGGEEAEIRQMDERAHRIDEQLLRGGGICADCK